MKVVIYNKYTHERILLDPKEMRMKRKRRRITAWAKYYDNYINKGFDRSKPYDAIFITLTCKTEEEQEKGLMRKYMKKIKERIKEKLIAYAWVCELQEREVIHYHIMLIVKKGTKIKKPDKGDWYAGSSNIQKAVKGIWYIISYLKKDYDHIPKGWRCFAIYSRGEIKENIRIDTLPNWVVEACKESFLNICGVIKKVTGGYIIDGEVIESPYKQARNYITGCAILLPG